MKGVLFNLVEEVVISMYDEDTWDDIIDNAGVSGVYASPGNYPDEEIVAIVVAAAELLDVPIPALLRIVGRKAFDGLARRHPELLGAQPDTLSFIRHVEDYIHPEVKKLYPEATLPKFDFVELDGGKVRLTYSSPRQFGDLAHGLIEGAADSFGETVVIERPDVPAGENETVFDLEFS